MVSAGNEFCEFYWNISHPPTNSPNLKPQEIQKHRKRKRRKPKCLYPLSPCNNSEQKQHTEHKEEFPLGLQRSTPCLAVSTHRSFTNQIWVRQRMPRYRTATVHTNRPGCEDRARQSTLRPRDRLCFLIIYIFPIIYQNNRNNHTLS